MNLNQECRDRFRGGSMKFGHFFKMTRKRAGMSQKEFAKYLNVSQSWVSKVEKDILEPSASQYLRVKDLAIELLFRSNLESSAA